MKYVICWVGSDGASFKEEVIAWNIGEAAAKIPEGMNVVSIVRKGYERYVV